MEKIIALAIKAGENPTVEEFEKRSDAMADVFVSLDLEDFPVIDGYDGDIGDELMYYANDAVFDAPLADGGTIRLPRFLVDNVEIATRYFDVLFVNGVIYDKNDSRITRANDTGNMILKSDGHKILPGNRYVEKVENLIYIPRYDGYTTKNNAVITADLGEYDLKDACYTPDGVTFYSFEFMMPGYKVRESNPIRFDATRPDKKIEDRRIGIEFEMENSEELGLEILKNPETRKVWRAERDGSLSPRGTEFVSIPLRYTDFEKVTNNFMTMANKHKAIVNDGCGFHVHITGTDLTHKDIINLVKFGAFNEKAFFDLVARSRQQNRFCKRMNERFDGFLKENTQDEAAIRYYGSEGVYRERHKQNKWGANNERHFWLNLDRIFLFRTDPSKITIEFRLHEATKDIERFNAFVKLCWWSVEFVKQGKMGTLKDVAIFSNDLAVIELVKNEREQPPFSSDVFIDEVVFEQTTINGLIEELA